MRRCTLLATLLPTCVVAMQTRLPRNVKAEALLKEAQALRQQAAQETRALHASRLALEHGEDVTVDALVSVLGTDTATAGRRGCWLGKKQWGCLWRTPFATTCDKTDLIENDV